MMELLSALIMGTVYVAAPGPIGVETLRHGLQGGFRSALAVQAGSALGLLFYAALALAGAGKFLEQSAWQPILGVCGMALLVALGVVTIRDGYRPRDDAAGVVHAQRSIGSPLRSGALLSLANPLDLFFWLSMGGAVLRQPPQQGLLLLLALASGCLGASLLIALFAAYWQSRLTARTLWFISWICGLALIAFGMQLGLATISLERM